MFFLRKLILSKLLRRLLFDTEFFLVKLKLKEINIILANWLVFLLHRIACVTVGVKHIFWSGVIIDAQGKSKFSLLSQRRSNLAYFLYFSMVMGVIMTSAWAPIYLLGDMSRNAKANLMHFVWQVYYRFNYYLLF